MTLPFLKWPGGKRWAASAIAAVVKPCLSGVYHEPFLGSGSVFFYLRPDRALLSDINPELIQAYLAVQRDPYGILRWLRTFTVSSADYYRIRSEIPRGCLQRTARFLYLNRTAFGGIYRLNQLGQFNVPFGGGERTPELLWRDKILVNASRALAGVTIQQSDFEPVLEAAIRGDVVYCDPTYTVTHDKNGFIRYNEKNFAWSDQQRLAATVRRAADRGVTVLVSNAHHQTVRLLYPDAEIIELRRRSLVSSKPEKRRLITEYLFIFRSGPG
jgi:DNA adenine methylase